MARSKRDVQQGVTFTSDNVLRVSQAPKAVDMETAMVQTKTKVLNKPRTPKVVKKKTGPKTGTKPKKKHIYEPNSKFTKSLLSAHWNLTFS
jgi:mannose-6-phosphate isomerase class I